ncbi:hypothetical protein [Nocardioides psychrotolerans]|uniref:hypothetical protein n=1 Tax=Nocardioides psychrotolerans TaxID=1005945 RepID=UPI003137B852
MNAFTQDRTRGLSLLKRLPILMTGLVLSGLLVGTTSGLIVDGLEPQAGHSSGTGSVKVAEVEPELEVTEQGTLRDLVTPEFRDDYDAYMADQSNRKRFVMALQQGLDVVSGSSTESGVQDVLAYGFDRDHVWITASYADLSRGLVWGAVAWCKRYVPAWACNAAGNWMNSMARGYAPLSNHGVWGAIYWNRYTGGRW